MNLQPSARNRKRGSESSFRTRNNRDTHNPTMVRRASGPLSTKVAVGRERSLSEILGRHRRGIDQAHADRDGGAEDSGREDAVVDLL